MTASRDREHMERALAIAAGGRGRVEPNPLVGAVVVRDGEVVGEGHHARYGGPHAEVVALRAAGAAAEGATLYVTLEPCAHEGKTPPCTGAILAARPARVVIAAPDPNPATAGRGPEILRRARVEVVEGVLEGESRAMNARYEAHLGAGLPWTIAKWGMSADGKIADVRGGSRYITGPESRRLVHEIRGAVDAVAVGVGTVLADDPDLSPRDVEVTRDSVRVVFDSRLRIPVASRLVATAADRPVWVVTASGADRGRVRALRAAGCRILEVEPAGGRPDLGRAFRALFEEGIGRVLLEGGGEIHAAALEAGVVRQVMAFVAPILLGGREAPTSVGGDGLRVVGEPLGLTDSRVVAMGRDALLEGFV